MKIFCLLLLLGGLANCPAGELGIASWYGQELAGRPMANGRPFDPGALTCARWGPKFGTRLRVTNVANGRSTLVVVTDRGPHKRLGREIDLSEAAFKQIADPRLGLIRVKIERIQ